MKVITPGHYYGLENVEQGSTYFKEQSLFFIQKTKRKDAPPIVQKLRPGDPEEFITVQNGTTNEEVLRVLIDRLKFLDEKFPCLENKHAINHLTYALRWFELRTKDRQKRDVEGKPEL